MATQTTLLRITSLSNRLLTALSDQTKKERAKEIREWLIENQNITLSPEQVFTVQQQVLPNLEALRQIYPERSTNHIMPGYLREGLAILITKWRKGDWSGAIKRGLNTQTRYDVNDIAYSHSYRIDPAWTHYKNACYFGQGDLVNGQIWYSRVELMRDGAHAAPQAGISGDRDNGAYSIVLGAFDEARNEGYADIDFGETIDYVGTALPRAEGDNEPSNQMDSQLSSPAIRGGSGGRAPTRSTQVMKASLRSENLVRVIRSYKMCDVVTNKPGKGYRYDGLYKVIKENALKEDRQIWSFVLKRVERQGRLRGFFDHESTKRTIIGERKAHSRQN